MRRSTQFRFQRVLGIVLVGRGAVTVSVMSAAIPKLPFDSPRWLDLDGVWAEDVQTVLQLMASTGATATSEGWREVWDEALDRLMHQGTVYDGAYAALPYLVEAAAALSPGQSEDLWVGMGFIVASKYRYRFAVPVDLEAGFVAALRLAERAAVRSFLATDTDATDLAYLALSCVAFAGHHVGEVLWQFFSPDECHLVLVCPGCGRNDEIPEFFVDPVRPPFEAPEAPDPAHVRQGEHPWGEVAAVLEERALGEQWEPFLRVARAVAAAGVPRETSGQAVLCLVAGMIAAKGTSKRAGREWARKLMLLTGYFRCDTCGRTWTIADSLAEDPEGARPHNHVTQAWTTLDGSAAPVLSAVVGPMGEAATRLWQDGKVLRTLDGTPWARISVFSDSASDPVGGVNSLAVVSRPGQPTLVAGAGDKGVVCLWNPADGRLLHEPLPGHPDRIRSMTALPLPDGRTLLATGGDTGTIALWDPVTARPVREPVGNWVGGVSGMCAATIPDGRTLFVTATPRGAVRLWDPATGESVGRLNPYGSPIQSIAAVPVRTDHTLIAASTTAGIQVWDPAVDDPWERGAAVQLSARALTDAGRRVAAVAVVPTPDRTLLATGDNLGVVMLWDLVTGDPVGDGLPASTGTAGVPAMTATMLHDGRTLLVTGSVRGSDLRVWEPGTGSVRRIALDVTVTCLVTAGSNLIVGHSCGVFGFSLTGQ
ncbi:MULTISPECIES: WD40 repeat domain-containing protein [unclassified Streptomyces]|uniref:WD40 repeat domain-containing protein n=1 Tax=unclassified Streptomyces TaxID=2593676 RepID=UPI0035DB365D